MAVRTAFREALQTSLSAALGFDFIGGPVDEPYPGKDIGCVWWEGKRPFSRDGNEEENYYRVRVLKLHQVKDKRANQTALSVGPLEDDAEELEAALKAVLTTAGHQFFTVVEVTPNYDGLYVEAQLVAYDRNRSASGG